MRRHVGLLLSITIAAAAGCGTDTGTTTMTSRALPQLSDVDSAAWARLAQRRIFFGHQSVGQNIMDGVADVLASHRGIPLRVVETKAAGAMSLPGFYHAKIGRNEFPQEKEAEFAAIVDSAFADAPGVAMLKFCYLDVWADTDPQALFDRYERTAAELRARHAGLTLVHVTLPLTTSESGLRYLAKKLLGRSTTRDVNAVRTRYNALLRAAYEGRAPVFDLAALESTLPDGSRSFTMRGRDTAYTLAAGYTDDGGHLNEAARRRVAEQLLVLLARLPGS